jgi:hypothetical protein
MLVRDDSPGVNGKEIMFQKGKNLFDLLCDRRRRAVLSIFFTLSPAAEKWRRRRGYANRDFSVRLSCA